MVDVARSVSANTSLPEAFRCSVAVHTVWRSGKASYIRE